MEFLTNEKLTIVGAAGMIGSNMAQTAMMLKLTPNLCLYDPYGPGLEGVAEEMYHCAFDGANITYTTDIKEALTGAAYVVSSGGAPRKQGMTREDLLKGNCEIAEGLGKNLKEFCPDVKHVVIIFNPADLTGLVTLLHSGLKPSQVTTLAALDSTRLQSALAKEFGVQQCKVTGCHTYGGHGEQMAFQSPAYVSIEMIAAAMGGKKFEWPAGCYVNTEKYHNVMMAMPTTIDATGVHYTDVTGTPEEMAALEASYEHLCKMRDEIIELGIIPAVADWKTVNPNL